MKRITNYLVSALIVLVSPTITVAYFDVTEDHQNFIAIQYLSEQNVFQGYADGSYKPNQPVNKVEALKVILKNSEIKISDSVGELGFSDTDQQAWYAPYISVAKEINIVNGNPDGTFTPDRDVIRAEFVKMLLIANEFVKEKWENMQIFEDVPKDEWYAPYMNYSGQSGLIVEDRDNKLYPGQSLTRGEVAEILYIMTVIRNAKETQFLIDQAEAQLGQIDIYINNNDPDAAKRAAELAVDMTQQAYSNLPEDKVVLGAAKLARAYDFVVNAYISAIAQNYTAAADWANQSISKATEAWEVNNDLQESAHHIKDRANEVLRQIPK